MLDIIPSSEKYNDYMKNLISESFEEDVRIPFKNKGIMVDGELIDSVYIALLNNKPVGFYSIWKNQFHPHSLYFNIVVDEKYRNQKIGTILYEDMLHRSKGATYLQCSFYESSLSGSVFLEQKGFNLFRRTVETSLSVNDLVVDSKKINTMITNNDFELLRFSDINSESDWLGVSKLVKSCYSNTHIDNPVKEMSIKEWYDLVVSDTNLESSFLVKRNKMISAYALMHEDTDDSMDLGWRGVSEAQDKLRNMLIEHLTNLQIEFAQLNNIKYLNLEVDDTDKWSVDMMTYLNLKSKNNWLSYQIKI